MRLVSGESSLAESQRSPVGDVSFPNCCDVENSPFIVEEPALLHVADAYYAFAHGYETGSRKTPAHVAWLLESDAIRAGWIVGRFVGSERDLIARFGVSRDVVREATRILEARGSMLMQRGRTGGLRLAQPDLDWAAGGFATFLRASGFSSAQLSETVAVAEPLLSELPSDHLIIRLYRRTLDWWEMSESGLERFKSRGFHITARLIQHYAPIPSEGVVLGSEDALCEKFACSRATFRQALRVLDDLGMLHVQRGRGGGYAIKRPSSLGVVRQMFAFLASQHQTIRDVLPVKWSLDMIKLRLAMYSLQKCDLHVRAEFYESLSSILAVTAEPHRWSRLQQALGRAAQNPFISTLLWCLVAYDVRIGPPSAAWDEIECELHEIEDAMVFAIQTGRAADAEINQLRAQALISDLFDRANDARTHDA
jgi:DNA-binding FadR family transcriptional regulator